MTTTVNSRVSIFRVKVTHETSHGTAREYNAMSVGKHPFDLPAYLMYQSFNNQPLSTVMSYKTFAQLFSPENFTISSDYSVVSLVHSQKTYFSSEGVWKSRLDLFTITVMGISKPTLKVIKTTQENVSLSLDDFNAILPMKKRRF